ncbi:MAG: bifunctional folylpolyglutamate synthase/dihydrofolate synthase [Candidatus Omnitrophica bacterium]|nr:bifunctional folylpolyglutamate synthase/dihydrofolate synthase [Candidatus Omnitrophota bacterium]
MTYREAINYLDSFINYEKKNLYDYKASFKLDRMRRLCAILGDPQDAVPSVHISGTKGKGSTAAMIQSILKSAGLKAGLYTSPHLVSFRERIRTGDRLIGEDDLGAIMAIVKSAVGKMSDDKPSFFEIYTALAYLYFKKEKADIAVYETGLGGRLDATNVIKPLISVITPVSYEHTAILGNTLAQIAFEKAGIIKEDSLCISAPQEKDALAVIEKVCAEKGSRLVLVGRDIIFDEVKATDEEEVFSVSAIFGEYKNLHMKMLGSHQVVNAAVAIGAAEALRLGGMRIDKDAIRKGIGAVRWPGRLEVIRKRSPRIILDGAQNAASARALARSIKRSFKYQRLILILGVSGDKDIKGILKEMVPIADSVILTRSMVTERAMDPSLIREKITPASKDVVETLNVKDAVDRAIAKADARDLILVTGSLFVVGEARHMLVNKRGNEKE